MCFSNINFFSNDDSALFPYLDDGTRDLTGDPAKFFFENNNEQEDYNQAKDLLDSNPWLPGIFNEIYNETKFGILPWDQSGGNNEERKNCCEKKNEKIFIIFKEHPKKKEEKKNIINEINNIGASELPLQNNPPDSNFPSIFTKKDIIKNFRKSGKPKIYIKKFECGHLNKNIKLLIKPYYERKRKKKRSKIGKHSRNSTDNILKKIKNLLLKKVIESCNKAIDDKKYKLKYFDYKHTSQIKKFSEIENLNSKIRDLLVKMPISEKYKNAKNQTNKEIIEKILENKTNNNKIKYLFNLTFSEWIDIFTRKKEPSCEVNLNNEFDSLLKTLFEKAKGNGNYFTKVIYCLYNYQRLILCKNSRENKKNKGKIYKK